MVTIQTEADVIRVIRENPRIVFRALQEDSAFWYQLGEADMEPPDAC